MSQRDDPHDRPATSLHAPGQSGERQPGEGESGPHEHQGSPFDPRLFRQALHQAADLVADYVAGVDSYPVLPGIAPGDVLARLPESPPEQAESFEAQLADYRQLVEPNVTHWNHPGFLAYFSSSGSEPGILGELLSAGLSVNGMLWHTSPVATELELRVCDWLRQMIDLPDDFTGHINDTASMSTFLALAVARDGAKQADRDAGSASPESAVLDLDTGRGLDVRNRGLAGRPELVPLVLYTSEQSHSSVDKAAIALGLGLDHVRHVETDEAFRMDPEALRRQIAEDRAAGLRPVAVVATAGTTSTTSVDPLDAIAEICEAENLWLHVDAAWAGSAAICPEYRRLLDGMERADSIVVNPHKWMFTPMDCSVLFVRDVDALRAAFSLVPEYLVTERHPAKVDLMDFGVQLGRRFRALKLWMVIRSFGVEGLRAQIRQHCRLGREFADWIEAHPRFELMAPVPFSTVCFRALPPSDGAEVSPAEVDGLNEALMQAVNRRGPIFLSHTKLRGRYVIRLAVSNLRTTSVQLDQARTFLVEELERIAAATD